MEYIRLGIIWIARILLKVFYIFPVKKNRIYLSTYKGTSLGDNPRFIYEYMREKYPGKWEYIWEFEGEAPDSESKTISPRMSFTKLIQLMTSGVIISNCGLGSYIPKRKSQLFINTWHGGGAFKRVGIDDLSNQNQVENYITKLCGMQTDIFVSSSKIFTEVMSTSKLIPKERFLECGMPRNDLIVKGEVKPEIENKIRERYHVNEGKKIVLYAPTFRGKEQFAESNWDINIDLCINALEKRFGEEWLFFMRKHHFVKSGEMQGCIDVSDYPDMQELLQVADVLITDYSSSMWDFSFTRKPGFLFAPDYYLYAKQRSFYTDPETWPYPLCKSNEELAETIESFNWADNEERIIEYWRQSGNCESGKAAEIIVDEIVKRTMG